MFASMGWPGVGVAVCFAIASMSFVVALAYTTVANILLMQAGAPLFAALMTYVLFREKISAGTWVAIVAVMAGVGTKNKMVPRKNLARHHFIFCAKVPKQWNTNLNI